MQFQSGLQDHLSWPPVVEINEAPSNTDIYKINNRIHYQRQSSMKTKSQMSQNRPEAAPTHWGLLGNGRSGEVLIKVATCANYRPVFAEFPKFLEFGHLIISLKGEQQVVREEEGFDKSWQPFCFKSLFKYLIYKA
ncbi:hypothetical protein CEXT_500791 [Caerostris extrusa]|uniref:Uncharacterized protein n=1 Tax=Caerostris extrusa TaxID=172846 RepID=A0AAV4SN32_CAEEX|nr:hypothetical protein CEXT_500791 [Caerostris extrusa]